MGRYRRRITNYSRSADLEEAYFSFLPETIEELISLGDEGVLLLATALEKHNESPVAVPYNLSDVTIDTPFSPHRNIICVGKNYREHIVEFDKTADEPEFPIFFSKLPTAVTGPNRVIPLHPNATSQVDYEANWPSSSANEPATFRKMKYMITSSVTPL